MLAAEELETLEFLSEFWRNVSESAYIFCMLILTGVESWTESKYCVCFTWRQRAECVIGVFYPLKCLGLSWLYSLWKASTDLFIFCCLHLYLTCLNKAFPSHVSHLLLCFLWLSPNILSYALTFVCPAVNVARSYIYSNKREGERGMCDVKRLSLVCACACVCVFVRAYNEKNLIGFPGGRTSF